MENSLYTKVYIENSNIVFKYIKDGIREKEYIPYEPYIFLDFQLKEVIKVLDFKEFRSGKTLYGNKLRNIKEYYYFRKKLKEAGHKIYLDIPIRDQFLVFNFYNKELKTQKSNLKCLIYDIETKIGTEFPSPYKAEQPVTMYSILNLANNKLETYGLKDASVSDYFKCSNEEELLLKFWEKIKDSDVISGWNIKFFDNIYMVNRTINLLGESALEHLNITPYKLFDKERKDTYYKFKELSSLDYMDLYRILLRKNLAFNSLDNVSKDELGEGKIEYKDNFYNLDDLYNKDFEKYIEYNRKDVELIKMLEDKLNLIENAVNLSYLYKSDFEDSIGTVKNWEMFTISELLKEKTIPFYKEIHSFSKESYTGAYVFVSNKKKRKWLASFDVASSYPNQIISYNISPETILDYEKLPEELKIIREKYPNEDSIIKNLKLFEETVTPILKKYNVTYNPAGYFYSKEFLGFFPRMNQRLFEKRYKFKKEAQKLSSHKEKNIEFENKLRQVKTDDKLYKTVLVSQYGAWANEHFHYFDRRLAESTSGGGRFCVKSACNFFESKGFPVAYIHTDSNYVDFSKIITKTNEDDIIEEVLSKANKLKKELDEYFTHLSEILNCTEPRINMELESIVKKGLFKAKAHYLQKIVWKNGIKVNKNKITGIQIIKTTSSEFVKKNATKIVDMILADTEPETINVEIDKMKKNFWNASLEEIALHSGVSDIKSKELGDKSIPIHVLGSLIYNKIINDDKLNKQPIGNGRKVSYIYIHKNNKYGTHCLAVPDKFSEEIIKNFTVDRKKMWEVTFLKLISELMELNETPVTIDKPKNLF